MHLSGRSVLIALALGAACFAPACSSLLGLGDFKDAPADAGSTGGSGGAAGGNAGTGGTTGTGGSAGTAGTAGDSGVAGMDGGTDASDAGTFKCQPQGAVFPVLTAADLGNQAINGDSLRVVDGGALFHYAYAVVQTTPSAGVPPILYVQRLSDSISNRVQKGTQATLSGANYFQILSEYIDQAGLHVVAEKGSDLVDEVFALDAGGNVSPPTEQIVQANACPNGFRAGCVFRNGTGVHAAVTCNEKTADGGGAYGLYLDGNPIDKGPSSVDDLVLHACTSVGPTVILQTGQDFGSSLIRYGKTAADLKTTHPFSLTTDTKLVTLLGPMYPTPAGDGVVILGGTLVAPPVYTPMNIYTGVVPLTNFADFDKVPVPELTQGATLTNLNDLLNLAQGDPGPNWILFAGGTMDAARVNLVVLGNDGKLLQFGQTVYSVPSVDAQQTANILGAAVGTVSSTTLVVWGEANSDNSNQHLSGQALFCSGPA